MDKNTKSLLKGLGFIATIGLAVVVLRVSGLADAFDNRFADIYLRGQGLRGWAMFVGFTALFTGVGLPRQVPAVLGGYAFGLATGGLLTLVGAVAGCAVAFGYARFMGQEFVNRRYGHRLARLNAILTRSPFSMTLVVRLSPIGSNLVTNLLAGVSVVPAHWFFLATALGYVPQTIIFCLLGTGIRVNPTLNITLSVVFFLLSAALGLYLFRRHKSAGLEETLGD